MPQLRPKFITLDCYGTLTHSRLDPLAKDHFADRVPGKRMEASVRDFSASQMDEILGAWKPCAEVLDNPVRRTRVGMAFPIGRGTVPASRTPYPHGGRTRLWRGR